MEGGPCAPNAGQTHRTVGPMTEPWRLEELRQARWTKVLEGIPKCQVCREPILQEEAVRLEEKWYCDRCLRQSRREVEQE